MEDILFKIQSQSEEETISFALELAGELVAGDILLLHGGLGMGKTVLARALIRVLCGIPDMEVPSPTFTLVQAYDSDMGGIWHFDLYRLCDPQEVYEIGWEEALSTGAGVSLVEWPERLDYLLPEHAIHVSLSTVEGQPNSRAIEVTRT
jgi:tRNA threonylcarbamoyl adenosine modification protein YjeE